MIRAEGNILIERTPSEVLEFVLDLDRYRQADAKISAVLQQPAITPEHCRGRARYRGKLRAIPTPSQWQVVELQPWKRLDLTTEPGQWTALAATFAGGFICQETEDGHTNLTHFEEFHFRRPASWALDPYLDRWMQDYLTRVELPKLKLLIEGQPRSK
jgi:hypothetical protein